MLKKSGVPTLVDVAREAGVSLKTASRALNGSSALTPETAERVRAVMERLAYRPNELARGLKAGRSSAIGMVVPNLADPFTASAVKAVQEAARAQGYVVILTSSDGDPVIEKEELESLTRRQMDGLIVAPAVGDSRAFEAVISSGIPLVAFDQPIRGASIDCVVVNNRKAAHNAVKHLIDHGYRRILAVGARPDLYTCAERVKGYQDAVREHKLTEHTLLVTHESELTPEAIGRQLQRTGGLDAIIALNYVATMLVLRALRQLGKNIGNDVAFISFDDFELSDMLSTSVTAVRQPSAEMGRKAAELLFQRIRTPGDAKRNKIMLSTTFHPRASCGCGKPLGDGPILGAEAPHSSPQPARSARRRASYTMQTTLS